MNPEPTKRAVIDVGRKCNLNCKFCYYSHLGDLRKQTFHPLGKLMYDVDKAAQRGNNAIDITGGEPTIYKDLPELIKYAVERYDMHVCVITNSLAGRRTIDKIIEAGVAEFLLSIHGGAKQQAIVTGVDDARERQNSFVDYVKSKGIPFRANCVISRFTQQALGDVADWAIEKGAKIVNFINMNPHGDWAADRKKTAAVVANLRYVEPLLNDAIRNLEEHDIGVNVRYYPMCRIAPELRHCVCNDLHVAFDPYEWDYDIQPKNNWAHYRWGLNTSFNIEWKSKPCCDCKLQLVCGGINNAFNLATNGSMVDAVNDVEAGSNFYHYRQNAKTLEVLV